MRYTVGDASKIMSFTPTLNGLELQPPIHDFLQTNIRVRGEVATGVGIFAYLLFLFLFLFIYFFNFFNFWVT